MVSSQKGSTPILMQNCVHDSKEVSIATKNQSIMYIVHTLPAEMFGGSACFMK